MSSFATGLFAGLAFFVVLPEAWAEAGPLVLVGALALWLVDRYLVRLCEHCGGAGPWPLRIALGAHSFLDGSLLALATASPLAWWALALHRIPETVAVFGLLRGTPGALRTIAALQGLTVAGYAAAGLADGPLWGKGYALAAGALIFLGWHRLHGSWVAQRLRWTPAGMGLLAMGAARQFGYF